MAKARVGFYTTKGDTLGRSHKSCPKCGPGIFLAEHANRRSCGRCGYSESKSAAPVTAPAAAPVAKPPRAPKAPKAAAAPVPPGPAPAK